MWVQPSALLLSARSQVCEGKIPDPSPEVSFLQGPTPLSEGFWGGVDALDGR